MLPSPASPNLFSDPFLDSCVASSSPCTQSSSSNRMQRLPSQHNNNNQNFDPLAKPFEPGVAGGQGVGEWQVVAAEFGGKAVAVLVVPGSSTGEVLVCTSPAFNSKCLHPGLSCLDWDSVVYDPDSFGGTRETSLASQSPLPGSLGDTFHDSGYDALTDNSSEVSGDTGYPVSGGLMTAQDYYYQQHQQPLDIYTPSDGLEQQALLAPAPTSPLVQYVPWVTSTEGEFTNQSQASPHLEQDFSSLSLAENSQTTDTSTSLGNFMIDKPRDDSKDEQIRDAFKKKVLTNIKASEEEKEYEEKKRRAFKKQILDNLKNSNNK